jgi:hypothetical protein
LQDLIGIAWWFPDEISAFIDEGNNSLIPMGVDQKRVDMKSKRRMTRMPDAALPRIER